jgi:hypothetical protein
MFDILYCGDTHCNKKNKKHIIYCQGKSPLVKNLQCACAKNPLRTNTPQNTCPSHLPTTRLAVPSGTQNAFSLFQMSSWNGSHLADAFSNEGTPIMAKKSAEEPVMVPM